MWGVARVPRLQVRLVCFNANDYRPGVCSHCASSSRRFAARSVTEREPAMAPTPKAALESRHELSNLPLVICLSYRPEPCLSVGRAAKRDVDMNSHASLAPGSSRHRGSVRVHKSRCGTCGKSGHNARTCQITVEISDGEDSDED